jgi:hypothetical protein
MPDLATVEKAKITMENAVEKFKEERINKENNEESSDRVAINQVQKEVDRLKEAT